MSGSEPASTIDAEPPRECAVRPTARRADRIALAVVAVGMSLLVASGVSGFAALVRVAVVFGICLGADVVVRRAGPGWRALALAPIGALGAVIGGVLAFSELTDVESAGRLIGAVMSVLGGGLALASAVRWTARAVRGWRRAVPITLVALLAYVLLLPLGIAVYATNPPRGAIGDRTPADVGLAFADAVMPTTDGVLLAGWYVPSSTGAAVVLLPGSGSTRSATLDHAAVLARHGFGVLLADPRGHGESEGSAMEFGWFGEIDIGAAVTYLVRLPDVDPARIAVVGLSMGGEEAIGALAADPRIGAVVAEGATGRLWRDRTWLADSYGLRGRIQIGVDAITGALADLLTDAAPPAPLGVAVAAAAPRPVLLVAAGDRPDEVAAATALERCSPATVSVWVVPGAPHIGGLATDPTAWDRRVTGFLSAALAFPGPAPVSRDQGP